MSVLGTDRCLYGLPHVIEAQQFTREWMETILFPLADEMEKKVMAGEKALPLAGKEMVSLFVGESLRTRARFEIAMRRLGGTVVFGSEAAGKFSSMAKGESLEDTITVLNEYGADVIVLRSGQEGDAAKAVNVSDIPIINAGDGPGQHPTQALLDLYLIQKYMKVDGISVAMIGDLVGSRTIHSLSYLLGRYKDVKIYFVSPEDKRIGSNIRDYLYRHCVGFEECRDVREIAHLVNVFYQTRTQINLGTAAWDRRDKNHGYTVIDGEVLALAKKNAIIAHPLPCIDEIVRGEVDRDPRAVYIKTKDGRMSQVKGGLYITMALLIIINSMSRRR